MEDTSGNCFQDKLLAMCAQPTRHLDIARARSEDYDGKIIKNNPVLSLDSAFSAEDDDVENTLYELIADTQDPFEAIDAKLDAEILLNEAQALIPQP